MALLSFSRLFLAFASEWLVYFSKGLELNSSSKLATLTVLTSISQVQAISGLICKVPLEESLPRNFKTYVLTKDKNSGDDWNYHLDHQVNIDAPKNIEFKVLIRQNIDGLHLELNNILAPNTPAPRKNYWYRIISQARNSKYDLETIDEVKFWLGPPDQCSKNYQYPAPGNVVSLRADDIQVELNEYDVWVLRVLWNLCKVPAVIERPERGSTSGKSRHRFPCNVLFSSGYKSISSFLTGFSDRILFEFPLHLFNSSPPNKSPQIAAKMIFGTLPRRVYHGGQWVLI